MKKWFKFALIVVLLVPLFVISCDQFNGNKKIWRSLDLMGIPADNARFNQEFITPRGVKIKSVSDIPINILILTDVGITNQLTRITFAHPDWNHFTNPNDYSVLVIEPMVTNRDGSPAIKVKGIQSAGTVIGLTWAPTWKDGKYSLTGTGIDRPYIVVPSQEAVQWRYTDYWMRSIWHESEHVREGMNDWNDFLNHLGANDIHPHYP